MHINQIMLIGVALIVLGLVSAPLGLSLVWLRSLGLRRGDADDHRRSTPNRPTPEDAEPRAVIRLRHAGSRRNKPLPRVRRMP
jgi:hypothetical protein